jgi:5-amino-6-(5-phosphoribosylamino)uracil reductase
MKIIACLAATLDGKIAYGKPHEGSRFNSEEDLAHLLRTRDLADATLIGGKTFRSYPLVHPRATKTSPYPHCIVTQTWNLPLDAPLFVETLNSPALPRVRIYAPVPPPEAFSVIQDAFVWVSIPAMARGGTECPDNTHPVLARSVVSAILSDITSQNVETLLVEGGGEIISLFLQAEAIDEFYLTLCPTMIGGQAPALVGGHALLPSMSPDFEITTLKQVENEIFLHLKKR